MNRLIVVMLFAMMACHSGKKEDQQAGWPEMESFHKLMAQAYHPLSDSGNLEPAKHLMESLANEATRWASAPLPEKVNTAEMKSDIEALRAGTEKLASTIKQGAANDEIELSLENLHAQFHKIMEGWNGDDHEHMHEEEH